MLKLRNSMGLRFCGDLENRVIRIEDTKNGEYRAIPMNERLFETLKMVDKRSDFVFHMDNGAGL